MEDIIADTYKVDHEWKIINLRLSNIVGALEHGVLGEYVTQLPKNIVGETAHQPIQRGGLWKV